LLFQPLCVALLLARAMFESNAQEAHGFARSTSSDPALFSAAHLLESVMWQSSAQARMRLAPRTPISLHLFFVEPARDRVMFLSFAVAPQSCALLMVCETARSFAGLPQAPVMSLSSVLVQARTAQLTDYDLHRLSADPLLAIVMFQSCVLDLQISVHLMLYCPPQRFVEWLLVIATKKKSALERIQFAQLTP